MSITLKEIKLKQHELEKMISDFNGQPNSYLPAGVSLAMGERYICSITYPDARTVHHILMAGDSGPNSWANQTLWAEMIGGELPSRPIQALMHELMLEEFKEEAYWSNTQHSGNSNFAWFQFFVNGGQYGDRKSSKLRARAVRRSVI